MYLVLEIELKLDNNNGIEYMRHRVCGKTGDLWYARKLVERYAKESFNIGYYNKIIQESTTSITLHNGDTAYKKYCIAEE